MSEPRQSYVGAALSPRETRKLCLGRGGYIGDLTAPGLLHAAFVRSPHAHARIRRLDTGSARRAAGIVAVLTGADLARLTSPLRIAPPIEGLLPIEMPALPTGKVRFVGDPVACVVGEDRYQVEDACALVDVVYAPLAAVVDPEHAGDPGLPLVDETIPANRAYGGVFAHGDVDAALGRADRVVEARFHQGRQTHAPLEPRGCLAHWLSGDETLTFWHSTQIPHPIRSALAARLGIPESAVRVITPDVGGGFGQKIPLYREELVTAAAARLLGRPVRWIETRRENLLASLHAREDIVDVRAAVSADGTILGIDARILADFGAYAYFPANYMARVVGMMIPGAYRLHDYRYAISAVLTNKCPSGPYRAPMLICSWVTEGTIDAVARALSLDPVEVRRRNMLTESDLPYATATGLTYRSVYPRDTLERALSAFGYVERRRAQAHARSAGRLTGIGVATYVEPNTYGSEFYKTAGIPGSGHDAAIVRVEPSGAVSAQIGVVSQGQGHLTTVAQALADAFAIPIEQVRVHAGDTAAAPYGMGTRGSRGGVVSAGAALGAARGLKQKILTIAAHLLEAPAEDLEFAGGRVQVRGAPAAGFTLAQIAQKAYLAPTELPPGMEPGLEATHAFDPPALTFSSGTHVCEVEIDGETGVVTIPRYTIVEDCGRLLNPLVVEGQLHGATAQGLAGALFEEVVYGADGQNHSATFLDYAVPTAAQLPPFAVEHLERPDPGTPLGMKGMAEGGVMGASAAISNAIADALAPRAAGRQPFTAPRLRAAIELGAPTWPPNPPRSEAPRRSRGAPRSSAPRRPRARS
ncbi:MAG TPA: xanthine dehydrogenase family protein molybdopterin-binding subunit [Methylomirabilota bacterium]|nr:xanthine dehydrogenase family protein molybdopterin-binding subunit [Methylomirabilota bacterium]